MIYFYKGSIAKEYLLVRFQVQERETLLLHCVWSRETLDFPLISNNISNVLAFINILHLEIRLEYNGLSLETFKNIFYSAYIYPMHVAI